MTIKHPDCLQCKNEGRFYKEIYNAPPWDIPRGFNPGSFEAARASFETVKEYCDCQYGKELQVMNDRINHPEYENPFASMSDAEIIDQLTRSSLDQKAIADEFEI